MTAMKKMEQRLSERPHECDVQYCVYEHGTHFVFPEGLVKTILPVGGGLITKVFAAGRSYPKECKETRIAIDKAVTDAISERKL